MPCYLPLVISRHAGSFVFIFPGFEIFIFNVSATSPTSTAISLSRIISLLLWVFPRHHCGQFSLELLPMTTVDHKVFSLFSVWDVGGALGPNQTERVLAAWGGFLLFFSMRVKRFAQCFCIAECLTFFYRSAMNTLSGKKLNYLT